MSVRGVNALRGSRALFRPPSYARYGNMIEEEPEQMQKPKGKRTTRPWPGGLHLPEPRAVHPVPADPSAKFTVIKIPNTSTAFSNWPTLNKFKPALQPRASGTIPPGARSGVQATVDTDVEIAILPHIYNDLGVLIFEGPQWEQVRVMADILQSVECEECRLPKRDWTTANAGFGANYDKWNVYRIKLNAEKHTEKRGIKHILTPNGLYDLTNIALDNWKADGIGGSVPVEAVPHSVKMYIVKHTGGPGLANDTINGQYLPQLHVYVATGIWGNTIFMSIEFHTVGTRRLVGVTDLTLHPTSQSSSNRATSWGICEKLLPSNTTRSSEIYRRAMFKLYKLEHELWTQRRRTLVKEEQDQLRTKSVTKRQEKRSAAAAQIEEKYLDTDGEA